MTVSLREAINTFSPEDQLEVYRNGALLIQQEKDRKRASKDSKTYDKGKSYGTKVAF